MIVATRRAHLFGRSSLEMQKAFGKTAVNGNQILRFAEFSLMSKFNADEAAQDIAIRKLADGFPKIQLPLWAATRSFTVTQAQLNSWVS
jgi:hypothetical protein